MKTKALSLESKLLQTPVIKLEKWESAAVPAVYIPSELPAYVYCELNVTELANIHQLEQAGYQFSEFRIKSTLNTSETEYTTRAFYPFVAEVINEKAILEEAI